MTIQWKFAKVVCALSFLGNMFKLFIFLMPNQFHPDFRWALLFIISPIPTSCNWSCLVIAERICFLLTSCTSPANRNSSRMKYAFSKLKMMSNSQTYRIKWKRIIQKYKNWRPLTLPKYLSSISTYRWMISRQINSLSTCSMAQRKYSEAYLR